jgi:hypothetical protein
VVSVLPEALVRAVLVKYEPPTGKASAPSEVLERLPFHFNPDSLSISKTGRWPRTPSPAASKAATPQFVGSGPRGMSVEMFFDAGGGRGNVQDAVESLMRCCEPTAKSLRTKRPSPPWIRLEWGRLKSFTAVAMSVSATYTLFAPHGTPLRARCSVWLEEMGGNVRPQNPSGGGGKGLNIRQVIGALSLAAVAYETYGDPTLWRPIAELNDLDDPALLGAGQWLQLPDHLTTDHEATS